MRCVLAGASGFLGSELADALAERGHDTTQLVRREPRGAQESRWDPARGEIDAEVVGAADVVIGLNGSGLLGIPQSRRHQQLLWQSRIPPMRLLAETVAAADRPPALLAGNGSSWYGHHGDDVVDETADSRGDALLTRITRDWQEATDPAAEAGSRVCVLRTAPVMTRGSAAMGVLRPLFRAGLGGRLGDGTQFFPLVSARDWVGAVVRLVESETVSGPINLCCPETPTNAGFTRALAAAVHRPAPLPVPAPLVRLGAGPMAPELLRSLRMYPATLLQDGYSFQDHDVRDVLAGVAA